MNLILAKAFFPLAIALLLAVAACGADSQYEAAPTAAPAATSAPASGAPVLVTRIVEREVAVPTSAPAAPPIQQPVVVATQGAETGGFNNIGGSSTVNDAAYDLTFFRHYGVNPFIDTEDDHLSTFALDVDTASYTVARRFLDDGNLPDPDSVRVEEFVNFFDQGYEAPTAGAFAVHVDGSPSPFGNPNHWLMRVGIQGRDIPEQQRQDATLVFAVDVSGSMAREERLGLVGQSLRLLVEELGSNDEVAIVTYGDRGSVLLETTSGRNKGEILQAIDSLSPGGSTYVEDGLRIAYGLASAEVEPGRITRVILLSDGVGNVGNIGPDAILRQVRQHVDQGVTLTTVGFGMGNYNDILMEQLANDGDGAYYYVDTLSEARRIFVDELTGTLQYIAKDAKVQVDFNPDTVSRYRLLGYENRDVADEDFRNDTVDAGEVGSGHSVTALYELKLREGAQGRLGTVHLRYEDAFLDEVEEISREFQVDDLAPSFKAASLRFQLSAVVAEFAEVLRGSYWAREGSLEAVHGEARRLQQMAPTVNDVAEFAGLAAQAARLQDLATGR